MKQSLQLKLGQQLTMTPQLQQAIRLLQLSTLDLQQEIQQALEANPLLEVSEDEDPEPAAETWEATEDNGASDGPLQSMERAASDDAPVRSCAACGSRTSAGSILQRFLTGSDAPVAVITTSLYQELPPAPPDPPWDWRRRAAGRRRCTGPTASVRRLPSMRRS